MTINELWHSQNEKEWLQALNRYWDYVKPKNIKLEKELNSINPDFIEKMSVDEFYNFLLKKYFKWKFTNCLFCLNALRNLRYYQKENNMDELKFIKQRIIDFNKHDISEGLNIATKIKGLGPAGGSGLLSLLFPNYFSTVDQFVAKALCEINDLPEAPSMLRMNPNNLTINNGILLIEITRNKAKELNKLFDTNFWTPRKIDMVLWSCRKKTV